MTPPQPVVLQVQPVDHPRGGRHRIEGAEGVRNEIRMEFSITAYRTPHLELRLEQQSVPADLGQPVGCHQPVGTGTDDYRIYFARQRHAVTPLKAPQRIGRPPVTAIRAPEM